MSKEFESIMEGLNDLLEYANGDKTKGRSKTVTAEKPYQAPLRTVVSQPVAALR